MVHLTATDLLMRLGASPREDDWAPAHRLAGVTALKQTPDGRFHDGHWWRGPLLQAMIRHYRPHRVLEFGTGRGYGALSMAWAACDEGLPTRIWTIDHLAPDTPQAWALDEGQGPAIRHLTLSQVWDTHAPAAWRDRITCITGDSVPVMKQWNAAGHPSVDFVFIDAGHDYWAVKHDVLAAAAVASPGAVMLLDDYSERTGYGVRRFVNEEVAPRLPPEAVIAIDVLATDHTSPGGTVPHEMVLLDGTVSGMPAWSDLFSPRERRQFARQRAAAATAATVVHAMRRVARHGRALVRGGHAA